LVYIDVRFRAKRKKKHGEQKQNKTKQQQQKKKKKGKRERKKERRQKINLGMKKITPWRMKGTIFERYEDQKKGGMRRETKPCKCKQK